MLIEAAEEEHKDEKEGPKTHMAGAGASLADVLKGGVQVQLKSTKVRNSNCSHAPSVAKKIHGK